MTKPTLRDDRAQDSGRSVDMPVFLASLTYGDRSVADEVVHKFSSGRGVGHRRRILRAFSPIRTLFCSGCSDRQLIPRNPTISTRSSSASPQIQPFSFRVISNSIAAGCGSRQPEYTPLELLGLYALVHLRYRQVDIYIYQSNLE